MFSVCRAVMMSHLVFVMVIISFFCSSSSTAPNGSTLQRVRRAPPPLIINPSRLQLMKEALSSMNFRMNGDYMNDTDVFQLFLPSLEEKYRSSKMYRSFVIAFQKGVIPKMTLKYNQKCTPSWIYRDPWNNSITWHYMKNLTFEYYLNPNSLPELCNYKEGVVCSYYYKTCRCPEGSQQYPVHPTLAEYRCFTDEDQVCNLIDLSHGNDPSHRMLAEKLPQMIFNLERPLSCRVDTMCRFTKSDLRTPRCYWTNNPRPASDPFYPPIGGAGVTWSHSLGQKCALDLVADGGMCSINTGQYGQLPGLTCYNLGPSLTSIDPNRRPPANRTGFCLPDFGPFGLAKLYSVTNNQLHFHPMILAFIHPRNVPLRDSKLEIYYQRLMDDFQVKMLREGMLQIEVGGPCSINKTVKMKSLWSWYANLDNKNGREYHPDASEQNLMDKQAQALNLTLEQPTQKICKVYHSFYRSHPDSPAIPLPELTCVFKNITALDGNDGTCQPDYTTNKTIPFAKKFQKFLDVTSEILAELHVEEISYLEEILTTNPEAECRPTAGPPPKRRRILFRTDVLEGGYCSEGSGCFRDYADHLPIYDNNCKLNTSKPVYGCKYLSVGEGVQYGKCEDAQLDRNIVKQLKKTLDSRDQSSCLGFGEDCQYGLEKIIRTWIRNREDPMINKYTLIKSLVDERDPSTSQGGGGFCDTGKLLVCGNDGVCGCAEGTKRRQAKFKGRDYWSDYCYVYSGTCKDRKVEDFVAATDNEEDMIMEHYYGNWSSDKGCTDAGGNLCVLLHEKEARCWDGHDDDSGNPDETGGYGIDKFVKATGNNMQVNWILVGGGALVVNLLFYFEGFKMQK